MVVEEMWGVIISFDISAKGSETCCWKDGVKIGDLLSSLVWQEWRPQFWWMMLCLIRRHRLWIDGRFLLKIVGSVQLSRLVIFQGEVHSVVACGIHHQYYDSRWVCSYFRRPGFESAYIRFRWHLSLFFRGVLDVICTVKAQVSLLLYKYNRYSGSTDEDGGLKPLNPCTFSSLIAFHGNT